MTAGRNEDVPRLPDEVAVLATRYLEAVDAALPGFVRMLYLTGSVALGGYQPGRSDVDALVVTARPAGSGDLAAIAAVHAGLPDRPHFDAIYLDRTTFAAQPADRRVVPYVVNGEFRTTARCGDLNPVLWLTLRRYGLPVRGPATADLGIRPDPAGLRHWNLDNLATYWRSWAGQARAAVVDLAVEARVGAEEVVWGVLGPARLHYTLAYTDIVTKAAAGRYLAETFPDWSSLAQRAVRWRAGEPVEFGAADVSDVADCTDAVVADAWRRWG